MEKIYLSYCVRCITSKCSLKCRDCAAFIPKYKEKKDYSLAYVRENFGKILTAVDGIMELELMGTMVLFLLETISVPTAMVRIGHTYGPEINLDSRHVYADLVKAIIENEEINIKNPLAVRPFTYVRDTIWGILLVALSQSNGEAYNLWNAKDRISIGKLACDLVEQVFADRNLKVYCRGREYHFDDIYDNISEKTEADTQKIEKLGWSAMIRVREGFQRTVDSFESQLEEI